METPPALLTPAFFLPPLAAFLGGPTGAPACPLFLPTVDFTGFLALEALETPLAFAAAVSLVPWAPGLANFLAA